MELNSKYRKTLFIIGFFILFSSYCIPNFYYRFIAIGIVNFTMGYFLLKINPFGKVGLFFIYLYFILTAPLIINGLYAGELVPGVIPEIIYLISCLFGYIVYKSNRKILYTTIYFIVFVILTLNHNNMMNYYLDLAIPKNNNIGKEVPPLQIHDYKGNTSTIKGNGKIQVVDIWATSCGSCIQAFPKFEKLKNEYKNDTEVMFYSLNLKLRESKDLQRANEFVKKYNFDNYFTNEKAYNDLNLPGIPSYMIIDKNGKIKYLGSLNMNETEIYNNIYTLIEKAK